MSFTQSGFSWTFKSGHISKSVASRSLCSTDTVHVCVLVWKGLVKTEMSHHCHRRSRRVAHFNLHLLNRFWTWISWRVYRKVFLQTDPSSSCNATMWYETIWYNTMRWDATCDANDSIQYGVQCDTVKNEVRPCNTKWCDAMKDDMIHSMHNDMIRYNAI